MADILSLGAVPDGVTDNTAIIQNALNTNAEVVAPATLDPFLCGPLIAPSSCKAFYGYGSLLLKADANAPLLTSLADTEIHGLRLLGGDETPKWSMSGYSPLNARSGLAFAGQKNRTISGLRISGFGDTGLKTASASGQGASNFEAHTRLSDCSVMNCFGGVNFMPGEGEYVSASNLHIAMNRMGYVVRAGNVGISGGLTTRNGVAVYMNKEYDNNGHGSITGMLINHNTEKSVWSQGADLGFNISACCIFDGNVIAEDTTGLQLNDNEICVAYILFGGGGRNELRNNHMVFNAATGLTNDVQHNWGGPTPGSPARPSNAIIRGNWTDSGLFAANNA